MLKKLSEYARKKPLESGCWCYVLLTVVPGVLVGAEDRYVEEVVFRYLLPAAAAFAVAVRCCGARADALGLKGFGWSVLYSSPIAGLCLVNLIVGNAPEAIRPEQLLWVLCCALGEEILGRMLLFHSILAGARDREWGPRMSIVLAGVVFGLMHAVNYAAQGAVGTILQCCYTAGTGMLLAWSYQKSGCLWGGILWHALLNFTGLLFQ